jgi:hypothetical protein
MHSVAGVKLRTIALAEARTALFGNVARHMHASQRHNFLECYCWFFATDNRLGMKFNEAVSLRVGRIF